MSEEKGLSITTVVGLLVFVIAVIGWCFFAAEYAKEIEGWRPAGTGMVRGRSSFLFGSIVAMVSMIGNGIQQIPNGFAVVNYSVANRWWAIIGFSIVVGLVIAGGIGAKRLERELNASPRRRR